MKPIKNVVKLFAAITVWSSVCVLIMLVTLLVSDKRMIVEFFASAIVNVNNENENESIDAKTSAQLEALDNQILIQQKQKELLNAEADVIKAEGEKNFLVVESKARIQKKVTTNSYELGEAKTVITTRIVMWPMLLGIFAFIGYFGIRVFLIRASNPRPDTLNVHIKGASGKHTLSQLEPPTIDIKGMVGEIKKLPFVDQVSNGLKLLEAPIQVMDLREGPNHFEMKIMPSFFNGKMVPISKIKSKLKSLSAMLDRDISVVDGSLVASKIEEERQLAYFRDYASNLPSMPKTSFAITDDSALEIDWSVTPHAIFAGATGSGKTSMLNAFICSVMSSNEANMVRFFIFDAKRVLRVFERSPFVERFTGDHEQAFPMLQDVVHIVEQRYEVFEKMEVSDLAEYNEIAPPDQKMPYVFAVFEELGDLMLGEHGKDASKLIARIGQIARATGVFLILVTQRPDKDVVTGLIKANTSARFCLRVGDGINSRIVIDSLGGEKLNLRGDFLCKITDRFGLIRGQSMFLRPEEITRIINESVAQTATLPLIATLQHDIERKKLPILRSMSPDDVITGTVTKAVAQTVALDITNINPNLQGVDVNEMSKRAIAYAIFDMIFDLSARGVNEFMTSVLGVKSGSARAFKSEYKKLQRKEAERGYGNFSKLLEVLLGKYPQEHDEYIKKWSTNEEKGVNQ